MKNINTLEWKELIANDKNAVVIDCRSPYEWDEGILEHSKLIDLMNPQNFMQKAGELDKNKNYYVYCRSGVRSITACQILESIGVENTYNLLGGILSWSENLVLPSRINKAI